MNQITWVWLGTAVINHCVFDMPFELIGLLSKSQTKFLSISLEQKSGYLANVSERVRKCLEKISRNLKLLNFRESYNQHFGITGSKLECKETCGSKLSKNSYFQRFGYIHLERLFLISEILE